MDGSANGLTGGEKRRPGRPSTVDAQYVLVKLRPGSQIPPGDWLAIEHEVRHTDHTLAAIAAKHAVGYETLKSRVRFHGWRRARNLPEREAIEMAQIAVDQGKTLARNSNSPPESPTGDARDHSDPETAKSRQVGAMADPSDPRAIPLHRALVEYVSERHGFGTKDAYREKAILEGAALQLEMVRQHRGDIRGARELAMTLLSQLVEVAGNRESIIAAINDEVESSTRRAAMVRAVALPSHIVAMRDLSTTLRQLIPLERQALGIPDAQPIEPLLPRDPTEHVNERVELSELEAAIDRQLGRQQPNPA